MSVLVQSFCEVKKIYEVPSSVFIPRPKVTITFSVLARNKLHVYNNTEFCLSKVDASVIQLTALPNPFLKGNNNSRQKVNSYK